MGWWLPNIVEQEKTAALHIRQAIEVFWVLMADQSESEKRKESLHSLSIILRPCCWFFPTFFL
jgi:hypothetical protein